MPLTRATTDPEGDVRRPDFTTDAGGPVISLAYTADGNTLASGDAKHAVALWDVKNGRPVRKPDAGEPLAPGAVTAFSVDGAQAASVAGISIKVWGNGTGRLLTTLLGHTREIRTLVFSPNGRTIASGGDDGAIRLWTMPLPPLPAEDLRKIEAAIPCAASAAPKRPHRVLVFWRADAIQQNAGVPAANKMIELLAHRTGGFQADFSRDYDVFDPKILSQCDAIIMNNTAHLAIPDDGKKAALLDYVRRGAAWWGFTPPSTRSRIGRRARK